MRLRSAFTVVVVAAALTACGDSDPIAAEETTPSPSITSTPSPTPTPTPTQEPTPSEEPGEAQGTVIEVTVEGDRIRPAGERIEAAVGETVVLEITSDRAGELHVHSTPDQYVTFAAGAESFDLVFDRPGVVEIEDHDTGFVIVQVQVQ